jgi:choline dehydrogenase-like flavoprotein
MTSSYDVIVIGSGAGGGTLVHRLAPSGKRVLLLERGDWLQREPQNWLAQDVFVDGRYMSADVWYDEKDEGISPVGASRTSRGARWTSGSRSRTCPWPRTASR